MIKQCIFYSTNTNTHNSKILIFTGQTFKSSMYNFCVSNNTIGRIVPETSEALFTELQDDRDYMKVRYLLP